MKIGTFPADGVPACVRCVSDMVAISLSSDRAIVIGAATPASAQIFSTSGGSPLAMASRALSMRGRDVEIESDSRYAIVRAGASPDGVMVYRMSNGGRTAPFATTSDPVTACDSIAIEVLGRRAVTIGGAGVDSVQIFDLFFGFEPPNLIAQHALGSSGDDVLVTNEVACVRAGATPDGFNFYSMENGSLIRKRPSRCVIAGMTPSRFSA